MVDHWEKELRPFLARHSDTLPQLQRSGRAGLDLDEFRPVFASGAQELLANREFQNLLLIRLTRTRQANRMADNVIDLLENLDQRLDGALAR